MIRSEVFKSILPVITNELVICNIGLPSQELFVLNDQPTNFYMLGTMGLASSVGLGLALSQSKKVICKEGVGVYLWASRFCRGLGLLGGLSLRRPLLL